MQLLNQAVVTEHLNMQAAIDAIEAMLHQQAAHPKWINTAQGRIYRCPLRFMMVKKNILP